MLITVFTPTYNRAYRLGALYESLCKQTFRDFEWLIVDDGSTDNTRELVEGWISENKIDIRYIAQPNGGKHRAINRGVGNAEGTLFFIVDSDDILPADSLEIINENYLKIKNRNDVSGIVGLKAYYDGSIVGNSIDFGYVICNNQDIDYKYRYIGDKADIMLTSIMKQFPFPDIEGEKFCPEGLIWNRISDFYKQLYFSKPVYLCEYLNDGLTAHITKVRVESPIATCCTYAERLYRPIPFKDKVKSALNYWRFYPCIPKNKRMLLEAKADKLWGLLRPFGFILHYRDKRVLNIKKN